MAVPGYVQTTTIQKYLKGAEDQMLQKQLFTAMLKKKGRISYNNAGTSFEWRIRMDRNTLVPYEQQQVTGSFAPKNRHKVASLPYRNYTMSESIDKISKLQNSGKEAIVNLNGNIAKWMKEDFEYHFASKFWNDGNASGNELEWHGLPSWTGTASTDQYPTPSDTYAGLSTALGSFGGSVVSGAWPSGKFDPAYYAWSPLLVNYTHASFGASWAVSCIKALRDGMIFHKNACGRQGEIDVIFMTASMFSDFLDAYDEKERLVIERGEKSGPASMGFTSISFDGTEIVSDIDVPDTQAWGVKFDSLEMMLQSDSLIVTEDDYEITRLADQYLAYVVGNLKGNPRSTILWDNYT